MSHLVVRHTTVGIASMTGLVLLGLATFGDPPALLNQLRSFQAASTPPSTAVGLTQLDHGSPALPPAGTWPDAIAPATAPMQYGTSTDEIANAAPKLRRLPCPPSSRCPITASSRFR